MARDVAEKRMGEFKNSQVGSDAYRKELRNLEVSLAIKGLGHMM